MSAIAITCVHGNEHLMKRVCFHRLRTLTETLVAKQAALEVVQSERSSLVLQLERANKLLETGRSTPQNDSSTRVLLNITDDGKIVGC